MNQQIQKQALLDALYSPYKNCVMCPLGSLGRTNIVFGEGNPDAQLLLIGEGPGKNEDALARPFIGRSGQLLTKALNALEIHRDDIYITNIVKCRPPNNRAPLTNEVATCTSLLLEKQIKIIQPRAICTLGSSATNTLLKTMTPITKIRGTIQTYQSTPLIPTYHPAYILRNPKELVKLTQDLEKALKIVTQQI